MRQIFALAILATLSLVSAADTPYAPCLASADGLAQQQHCCKAHKGICGCRAGKIVCCDKTFAEGCTCNREDEPLISS